MILQQIRLKGFLGHRGQPDGNGGFGFITVDWRAAPLWLVYGRNGAGKSSLFDAISFALWKRARGKGEGGTNFDRLIHHGCDRAEVELDIELGGQQFRVTRMVELVGRKDKKTARVSGQVLRREGESENWHVVTGYENKPEKWAEAELGMTWKTFSYAVLLRQGEADAFLKAEPKDRRECLWELLEMEHFQMLGKSAGDESRTRERDAKISGERLDAAVAVGDKEVKEQNTVVVTAEKEMQSAQTKYQAGEQALRNAKNAEDWRTKIKDAQMQQGEDAPLLERADEIRMNAKREREIKDALPFFKAIWDARETVKIEAEKWQTKTEEVGQLQSDITQTEVELGVAQNQRDKFHVAWQTAQKEYEDALQNTKKLEADTQTLTHIEDLETKIKTAQQTTEPHRAILQRAPEIESAAKRFNELQNALPPLRALNAAKREVLETRDSLEKVRIAAEEARADYETAQHMEGVLQAKAAEAERILRQHDETLREQQAELTRLKDRFEARETIEGHEECPTCGSRLDNDDARHRLQDESHAQREESARREQEIASRQKQRGEYSRAKESADKSHQEAREILQNASQKNIEKTSEESGALNILGLHERAEEKAKRDCGAWAEYSERLEELETEFQNLTDLPQQKADLQRAEIIAGKVETALELHRDQLENLPRWDETQRAQLRQDARNAQELAKSTQTAQEEAKQFAETKEKIVRELEKRLGIAQGEHQTAQAQREDLAIRHNDAATRLERSLSFLPDAWKTHPAREDAQELNILQGEKGNLSNAPAQAEELDEAQRRSSQLVGTIQTLREQIEKIPNEHRRAPDEIEAELGEASQVLKGALEEYSSEQKLLGELRIQQTEYARISAEHEAAITEARLSKKLAEALGKSGLQSEILGDAQRKLSHYANKTLDNLSQGRWQIALEPNESNNGLEILARDMDHPLRPVLAFEQTSSGEQFRIAVATAIAIGQAVSGRQAISTLIVDEGFGRLDKDNRNLMVDELRRLSQEILNGGRVIVVSHQDDVCDQFDYRLRVERDDAGVARVETTLAGA